MAAKVANLRIVIAMIAMVIIAAPKGLIAADPDPLQDFCIADLMAAGPTFNGYPCTDPTLATSEDFAYSGLAKAANLTGNPLGGAATFAFTRDWPAVNTLGLSLVRLDLEPGGIIMPHTHNLATEILYCLEGEIYTGFVTNSDNPAGPNKLFAKTVKKGELYIFPRGLLHFQLNKGKVHAASINALNGASPGIQLMPVSMFGSGMDPEVLMRSFFLNESQVTQLAAIQEQLVNILVGPNPL